VVLGKSKLENVNNLESNVNSNINFNNYKISQISNQQQANHNNNKFPLKKDNEENGSINDYLYNPMFCNSISYFAFSILKNVFCCCYSSSNNKLLYDSLDFEFEKRIDIVYFFKQQELKSRINKILFDDRQLDLIENQLNSEMLERKAHINMHFD
jgi:hypothetical protein